MRLAAVVAIVLCLAGCREAPRLPEYGTVPGFQLTSQTGDVFDSRGLQGKIWVADFIFTTCMGPCPRMSAQMRQVGKRVQDLPDLRLVSFTVDPEHDTPEVLAAYSKRFQASPERWVFLTGPVETLNMLSFDSFKLGRVDDKNEHSTRFVLVDRRSRIRGYYATWESGVIQQLVDDIRLLYRENS